MQLLPAVTPAQFRARWAAFDEAARFLDLTPADRNIAWREQTGDADFVEWPVPIEHFIADPFYIGTNVLVRPRIAEFLADFMDPNELWVLFAFVAGIGAGKSFSAALLIVYTLYQLGCLRQPQRYLSQFPGVQISNDSELVILNASGAGARQAVKVVYNDTFEKVTGSPWFQRHFQPYADRTSELEFPGRIRFSPGTGDARSALGFNVYAAVVDEAAFGRQNELVDTDSVRDLFEALNQRRRSRFGRLGWVGLFTSPQSESAYVELIASEGGQTGGEVLVRRITTWEAKDELQPGARVFLLDRDPDRPRIVEGAEELIWISPGLCQDPVSKELIRFGELAPGPQQARDAAREGGHPVAAR